MNKAQLVEAVGGVVAKKKEAQAAVDTVLDSITRCLQRGESVTLAGFGTFGVRMRKARLGRNPRTGETLTIPARRVPVFKAGKKLKASVA